METIRKERAGKIIYSLLRYEHKEYLPLKEFEKRNIPKEKVKCLLEVDEKILGNILSEK